MSVIQSREVVMMPQRQSFCCWNTT